MAKRYIYLEDFVVGEVIEIGSCSVSRDEIVEFARRYDPQPFHVDENAAKASIFGGLIASGWHTASMFMRLVDRVLAGGAPRLARNRRDSLARPAASRRRRGQARIGALAPSLTGVVRIRYRSRIRRRDGDDDGWREYRRRPTSGRVRASERKDPSFAI
jgi:hypothetical protein